MPWQCSICGEFSAEVRGKLLNHIGRCHRNDPNFHCLCGVDGCTRTFKNYYTWRKHLKQKHTLEPTDANENINNAHNDLNDKNGLEIMEENINNENTRLAALYILKIQEEYSMPKSTIASIIANTKTFLQDTLKMVETQVKGRLEDANIAYHNVPGLQEIFHEDNPKTNPFNNLETEAQRRYYKENFGLKVVHVMRNYARISLTSLILTLNTLFQFSCVAIQ